MNREKKSKSVLMIMVILFASLTVAAFLMFKLTTTKVDAIPNQKVEAKSTNGTNKDTNKEYEEHLDPKDPTTALDKNEEPDVEHLDPKEPTNDTNKESDVEIEELVLSAPVVLKETFNPESSTNFRGVFDENRVYVLAFGGQLYHYDLKKSSTFTYENFVKEAFVDSKTGNLVFTRELKDVDLNSTNKEGEFGLYRTLKEYPEDELMFKIPESTTLDQAVFFKEYVLLSFSDYNDSNFTKVIPLIGTELDVLGKNLEKTLSVEHYGITTDGNRLIAFDAKSNEVVELTSGKSETLYQPKDEVYSSSLDVYGESYLFSYAKEDSTGVLIYNGKEIGDGMFSEIHFYNENYAFTASGFNLNLLHLNSGQVEPISDISMNIVVSENSVHFQSDYGEINKITIKKNAQ
jgi:hypothetical protein